MPFQVQARGSFPLVPGSTPDELYGANQWGAAFYEQLDLEKTGGANASTFQTLELARVAACIALMAGNLIRIVNTANGQVVAGDTTP